MSQGEYNQVMLERMQQLEEALVRAKAGCASEDDWKVIYFECGLTPKCEYKLIKDERYEFNSISK
jgi:hypothetical protein